MSLLHEESEIKRTVFPIYPHFVNPSTDDVVYREAVSCLIATYYPDLMRLFECDILLSGLLSHNSLYFKQQFLNTFITY